MVYSDKDNTKSKKAIQDNNTDNRIKAPLYIF